MPDVTPGATPVSDDLMYEVPGQVLQRMTADIDRLAAENERLRASGDRFMRIIEVYVRSLYAVKIDVIRGDTKAVMEALSEGLDGFDGPEWDGTETGQEWLERTRGDRDV